MKKEKQNRREFLQMSAATVAALSLTAKNLKAGEAAALKAAEPNHELTEITVAGLQAKMKSGEITSRALVEKYLERIKEIDPKIHSVIELNPDAPAIADALDKERKKGKVRGALHGIPVLIKDNIETADKMKTTAGSLALIDASSPKRDAFIAERLRKSGAIILGKTNLSEWANFRSTKSISGWSGRGGQTNNPYVLDKNPCGSSSGTGAAISANLAAIGVGTETNGSIICPSLRCGLVGIKPTLGLISRSGIIPISHTQDTAGPMARTVADAAILLSALAGKDKRDAVTANASKGEKDYAKFLDKDGLRGARLGVPRSFYEGSPKIKAMFEPHLERLKAAGAILIDAAFQIPANFGDDETKVLQYEFKAGLNKYLAARNAPYKTLADLIKFNEDNKTKEMPLFGQEIFIASEKRGELTDADYIQALGRLKRATQADGIDAALAKDKLDAFVTPTVGTAWSFAAIAGYPFITVPADFIDGLPSGVAFFGGAFSEPRLIKFAYVFEQMTRLRQTPKFLPAA